MYTILLSPNIIYFIARGRWYEEKSDLNTKGDTDVLWQ